METTPNTARTLPRRKSAKKAQQVFAEQLDSDDSDGGADGQGASETRRSRVSVKKTGAKRSKIDTDPTPTQDTKPLVRKGKGRAKSPPPEATSNSVLVSTTSGTAGSSTRPRPQPRPRTARKKSSSPLPPLTVVTPPQVVEDEVSPLSSLSSCSEAGSPLNRTPASLPQTFSLIAPTQASSSSLAMHASDAVAGPSRASIWSLSRLGGYGWALVDKRTFQVHNRKADDKSDSDEKIWWPAKFDRAGPEDTLDVSLFGKGGKSQRVVDPSEDNVLSYYTESFLPRFSVPKFVVPASSIIDLTSPRKKPKLDRGALEKKWGDAVQELKKERQKQAANVTGSKPKPLVIGEDNDKSDDSDASLPEIGKMFNNIYEATQYTSTLSRTDSSISKGKRKRRSNSVTNSYTDASDHGAADEVPWVVPEPDLEPGELGLSRDKRASTVDYWPAKVIEYIPPASRKQPPRYRVTWLDDDEGIVERSWFYAQHEDGFATCKLGQFHSSFSEVQNDTDDEDAPPPPRSPSPVIEDPSPSSRDFSALNIRLQFQYTKEVLKAILVNEYGPTQLRHSQFVKGGRSREFVVKNSASRGKMNPNEVDLLLGFIKGWCLRDEVRVAQDLDTNTDANVNASTTEGDSHDELVNDKTPRGSSPIMVDAFPSSPPEPPPSSLPPSRLEREGSVLSDVSNPGPSDTLSVVTEPLSQLDDVLNDLSGAAAPDARSAPSRPDQHMRVSQDFKSLSGLHKADYCLNILVPEAVRQILLWRSGQRTSISLLTPAEEQDLYERGEVLMNERDWVHDIMRMHDFQNRHRKGFTQQHQGRALGHNRTTSGSRLRKNVAMPNYLE